MPLQEAKHSDDVLGFYFYPGKKTQDAQSEQRWNLRKRNCQPQIFSIRLSNQMQFREKG